MKHVLSYHFKASDAEVELGLKTTSYRFVETLLADMADRGALDEIFAQRIDCWNQCKSFIDAFTTRKLMSSRLTRAVAQRVKVRMERTP